MLPHRYDLWLLFGNLESLGARSFLLSLSPFVPSIFACLEKLPILSLSWSYFC